MQRDRLQRLRARRPGCNANHREERGTKRETKPSKACEGTHSARILAWVTCPAHYITLPRHYPDTGGNRTVTHVPSPTTDATVSSASCASVIHLAIDRPSPAPSARRRASSPR